MKEASTFSFEYTFIENINLLKIIKLAILYYLFFSVSSHSTFVFTSSTIICFSSSDSILEEYFDRVFEESHFAVALIFCLFYNFFNDVNGFFSTSYASLRFP